MNTLQFYPKGLRKQYIKNMRNAGITQTPSKYHNGIFFFAIIATVLLSTVFFFLDVNMIFAPIIFFLILAFFYFKISINATDRIKKMESVFPDVISLMASNLRSGITIDRAFLLAAKPEFAPLDKEILETGRFITTGQDIIFALKQMGDRIDSEKISKIIMLIISGLKAGGNISDLLEQTAANMKRKEVLEKKSSSTILMYVIFIFFAVGVGAPLLFGLSSVLVEIVIELTSKLPDVSASAQNLPFSFTELSISLDFVIYFSIFFIVVTDFISSLVLGLVRKGNSKSGLKYFIPLVVISIVLFFLVRLILGNLLVDNFLSF